MSKKYKATAYLRLSYTDDRSTESDSITNQKKLIEDYVAKHPEIELVSERVDDGYSGIVFDRPAFQQMLDDIKNEKVNCVIVKDLSRLGREHIDTSRYLRQIFPAFGVRFVAINDNIDTVASIGLISNQKLIGSGKWQTRTVNKILTDAVYTGDMVQGKSRSVKRKQTPTVPEDWIVVKGTHEPLISRELFEQVQAIRVQAAAKYKQNEKIPYSPNILKGRIYCAYCGKSLHRQRSHDRYFFRCISDDRIGEGACPGDIRLLPEKELFDAILTIIQKEAAVIIGTGCRLKRSGSDAEQKAATEKEIARFQQEMERDRKYLIRLYEDFVTGILAPAEYTELKTGYEQKIKTATAQSQQLSAQQKELETQMSSYIELSDWLTSLNGDVALTGDLIERLVERIVVYGPQKIEVYFKFRNEFGEVNKDG